MRFRVVLTLSAAALICLAGVALAQQRPGGGRPGGGGFGGGFGTSRLSLASIEAVQKELGLEPAQIEAIQKLRDELRPMREGGKGRPGGKGKAKAPEASNRVSADWYFVQAQAQPGGQRGQLTPEQIAEFQKQAAERAKVEKTKLAEILLPNQLKRLNEIYLQQLGTRAVDDEDVAKELSITAEQKTSIAKVREDSQAQMRELFTAGAGGDREAARTKMTEMRKASDEKILAVLTADQKAKLEELKGKPFELPEGALRGGPGGGAPGGRRPANPENN